MTTQNKSILEATVEELKPELSKKFPADKVEEIFKHYIILKRAFRRNDYEECLLNGGKFVEALFKGLHYLATGDALDVLDNPWGEVTNLPNIGGHLSKLEKMTLPRMAYAMYELRSRRGGAHNISSFDPNKMDCACLVSLATWLLQELIRLYYTKNPQAAELLVENLLVKDLPLIEDLDGDMVVLVPDASARVQLELLLYYHYDPKKRCTEKELIQWVKKQSPKNVQVSLRNLVDKTWVHKNEDGYRLTTLGVQHAEQEIDALNSSAPATVAVSSNVAKVSNPTRNGARNGQRKPTPSRTRRAI